MTSEYRHTVTAISLIGYLYGIVRSCLSEVSYYTCMGLCFILCSFAVTPVFITPPMATLFSFLSGIVTSKIREQVPCFIYLLNNFSVTLFPFWGGIYLFYCYTVEFYCTINVKPEQTSCSILDFSQPLQKSPKVTCFLCVLVRGRTYIFSL